MKPKSYVFTTLAMNQTLFFKGIAKILLNRGHQVYFICFHERSHELLLAEGFSSFNPYPLCEKVFADDSFDVNLINQKYMASIEKFKIPNWNYILSHEVETFRLTFTDVRKRFVEYIYALDQIFLKLKNQIPETHNLYLVQELGGFSSLISSFYVGEFYGFKNYFLEPSFFKGRVFVIPTSFEAYKVREMKMEINLEANQYLDAAIRNKTIVIPEKDKAHYYSLFNKVFRFHNFKRLYEKLIDKLILGKREEFQFIGMYTKRHLMMFVNKFKLKKFYKDIPTEKFIYFPLHVPMDVALTVRSPHCLDQYMLIDFLCRSAPQGYKVVFKEHPAMVGVMDSNKVKDLLLKNDNLIILKPEINNYEALGRADVVITVNSKAGAEALMLGRKVIVLGDSFYCESDLVYKHRDFSTLGEKIKLVLSYPSPEETKIRAYFQTVWNESYPGEIYSLDPKQLDYFVKICESLK